MGVNFRVFNRGSLLILMPTLKNLSFNGGEESSFDCGASPFSTSDLDLFMEKLLAGEKVEDFQGLLKNIEEQFSETFHHTFSVDQVMF